ncbi:DUF1990 family protein [Mycobacterium sp. SMC-4]|uniref:DUF1990 family protein n=1 Tax=Mycobacterium sp. SMC-4 TaxID=2857059 RepID=UPI003CFEE757
MKLSDVRGRPLTYSEIGATGGSMPSGYRHVRETAVIGHGRERFEEAAAAGMRWGMLRGAGLWVEATSPVAEVGSEVLVHMGPIGAPCRVVYVVDEPDRRGFAYGTLVGHPESGEEMFAVRFDPSTGAVYAEVSAFSRHATWWSKFAGPVTSLMQRLVTRRYLRAV